jgi:hypothetical protein
MKIYTGILCFFIFVFVLSAKKREQNLHSVHTVFGIEKLKPHCDYFAIKTAALPQKKSIKVSKKYLSKTEIKNFNGFDYLL